MVFDGYSVKKNCKKISCITKYNHQMYKNKYSRNGIMSKEKKKKIGFWKIKFFEFTLEKKKTIVRWIISVKCDTAKDIDKRTQKKNNSINVSYHTLFL